MTEVKLIIANSSIPFEKILELIQGGIIETLNNPLVVKFHTNFIGNIFYEISLKEGETEKSLKEKLLEIQ